MVLTFTSFISEGNTEAKLPVVWKQSYIGNVKEKVLCCGLSLKVVSYSMSENICIDFMFVSCETLTLCYIMVGTLLPVPVDTRPAPGPGPTGGKLFLWCKTHREHIV